MVIRALTPELQETAENELGEVPSRRAEDLDNIRQWLLTQNHLKCRTDDQWLISFLRGCKFNLERTKIKIDNFYRMRTLLPEFFKNRDPFQPEIQEFLKAGLMLPLPISSEAAEPRILIGHFNAKINVLLLIKMYSMFLDVLILEDDRFTICGMVAWSDCEAFPLSCLLELTPNLLKKFVYGFLDCYPIRIKKAYNVNVPLGVETATNLLKTFLSEKLKSRYFVYGKQSSKKLDNLLDKKYMPQQLGGTNGCLDELTEYWKNKIESYRDWFLEDDNYRSIENLRSNKSTSSSIFSMFNPFSDL